MRRTLLACALSGGAAVASAQGAPTPATLFQQLSPSVWTVRTLDAAGRPLAQGSAVVVGPGRLITNCHVLRQAKALNVGRENVSYGATLEHPDTERDLCQIKVANFTAPPVTLAPPDALQTGARVYAIGSPRGLETTISDGLLSGIRRGASGDIEALQVSVPISPGSSGGGLFDDQGRLIGITTSGFRDSQNLNFALPAVWIADVPERAQAALVQARAPLAATSAPGAVARAGTPAGDRAFEYLWRDRLTGNTQTVVYRLDRVDGDKLIFNQGKRIERVGGGVIENTQSLGGEFDLLMPPGGWVSARPEPGATWRLDYETRISSGTARTQFRARAVETTTMRVANRELEVIRVRFDGHTMRSTSNYGSYAASAWYAPALGRVVRFEALARDRYLHVDESLELVDIRSE
ncbi:serine protease [uncultured Hydrogenophaga sp.]|uniref:S1C family serine protease n=1 Tax=uncultured Hydrogenophaga sp. TaxID=199683 RepID=UPI002583BD4E|nr:serine protease [uncultured Hydrogenophaga sp.]